MIFLVVVFVYMVGRAYPNSAPDSDRGGRTATGGSQADAERLRYSATRESRNSVKQYVASSPQALNQLLEADAFDAKQEKKRVEVEARNAKKQQEFENELFVQSKTLLKENWERELFIDKWRGAYRDYLNSDKWQRVRRKVMKRAGGTCEYCGGKASQVHHERYPKNFLTFDFSRENYSYLRAVCPTCHDEKHGLI